MWLPDPWRSIEDLRLGLSLKDQTGRSAPVASEPVQERPLREPAWTDNFVAFQSQPKHEPL